MPETSLATLKSTLPPSFIDALIGYAINPTQWELLARELETNRETLTRLDTPTFLTILSKAEALAWQLRGERDPGLQQGACSFFLLGIDGAVRHTSDDIDTLSEYCTTHDDRLSFTQPASKKSFADALQALEDPSQHQALVELRGKEPFSRYGYLIRAADLPSALNLSDETVQFGLLIAQSGPNEEATAVLRSSFQLTQAEAAICQQLSAGQQVKEAAQTLDISANTARNQLQAVFEKTGINRQSDLILMMTQLSVILSVIRNNHAQPADEEAQQTAYPPHSFALVGPSAAPRRMAYRRYGSGPRQVIYFHESGGSSRLPPGTHALASRLGLTIIAPERAGNGFSDPHPRFSFEAGAEDLEEFLDQLKIDKVSLLGYLAGAAHALAGAIRLGERVEDILLVAGRNPVPSSELETSPIAMLRQRITAQPWLVRSMINILRSRMSPDINRRLLRRVYGSVARDNALFDSRPEILEHMVGYTMENMTVSADGLIAEIQCFSGEHGMNYDAITAPITLWHGDADTVARYESIAEALGPAVAQTRIFKDCGSMVIYEFWEEVLSHFNTDQSSRASFA